MSKHDDDDEDKTGYKVAEKVSMDKILKQDAEDESLRKYKESLGLSANIFARTASPIPPPRWLVFVTCPPAQPRTILVAASFSSCASSARAAPAVTLFTL